MPPCCSSKLTPFKAISPAKFLVTRSRQRIGATNSPSPRQNPEPAIEQSEESSRFEQDNQNQQRTVNQQMQLGKRCHQLLMNQPVNYATNYGSPDRAHATYDRHQQNGHADTEREHTLRMDEGGVLSVNTSGCPGERSCAGVCQQLSTERVYSQVRSGVFILADGDQRQPKTGTPNPRRRGHGQHCQPERNIEVVQLVEGPGLENPVSAGTAGHGDIGHHNADCLADTAGRNGEVRTSQTEGGNADRERCQCSDTRRQEQRENRVESAVDCQCSGVCAEAVENGKAEGHLPAEPSQDVPGDTHGDPDEGDKKQPNGVWARPEKRKHDQSRQQQVGHGSDSESRCAAFSHSFHAQSCLLFQSPATPRGSTTNATT